MRNAEEFRQASPVLDCIALSDRSDAGHAIATRNIVYWHRELPPLEVEPVSEHVVEAASARVPGTLAHRDELWERCYEDLMAQAGARLEQEVARLGGSCAHVLDEAVDSRHDAATGESWLHGRFTYVLYRQPDKAR
jgi:uncharacterized protein CbrC (UPF0167 family)